MTCAFAFATGLPGLTQYYEAHEALHDLLIDDALAPAILHHVCAMWLNKERCGVGVAQPSSNAHATSYRGQVLLFHMHYCRAVLNLSVQNESAPRPKPKISGSSQQQRLLCKAIPRLRPDHMIRSQITRKAHNPLAAKKVYRAALARCVAFFSSLLPPPTLSVVDKESETSCSMCADCVAKLFTSKD